MKFLWLDFRKFSTARSIRRILSEMEKRFYPSKATLPVILTLMVCMLFALSVSTAMAGQPTPYARQANFTDHSENYPDEPHNGTDLDDEFNAVKTTLDETLDNLELIQRDDGAIANATIGQEQLKPSLLAQLGEAVVWRTSTVYAADDVVFYNNAVYLCLVGHTSGTFLTDLDAGKWEVIIDYSGGAFGATSTSSVAIGTGTKTFTIEFGKYFTPGDYVLAVSDADPATNFMYGTVTSYSNTTLEINSFVSGGSGSYADWSLRLSGIRGAIGPSGTLDFGALNAESAGIDGANDQLVLYDASEGGGTVNKIAVNDYMALSFNQTSGDIGPVGSADSVLVYNAASSATRKVLLHNILKTVSGLSADATPDVTADYLLSYDTSALSPKKVLFSDFYKGINGLTADTTPHGVNDLLVTYDASASAPKKVTFENLMKGINNLTEDSTPDVAADYVVTWDNSATSSKKVLLQNIAGGSSGRLLGVQTFTSSGTWNKPGGTGAVRVVVVGGGGGGAGAHASTGNGAAGNNSSFGSHCTGNGGAGGVSFAVAGGSFTPAGGAGGGASGGDLNIDGQPGEDGINFDQDATGDYDVGFGGDGGNSYLGMGGRGARVAESQSSGESDSSTAGTGYGSGGGAYATKATSVDPSSGGGGGAGGTCIEYITTGLGSTETVTVGTAGGGGTTGGSAGANGVVIVESYSQ